MEAGEAELRKAFEEVATRNINTILEYSKETRKLLRELEKKAGKMDETIRNQSGIIDDLKKQLSVVQTLIFSGGT